MITNDDYILLNFTEMIEDVKKNDLMAAMVIQMGGFMLCPKCNNPMTDHCFIPTINENGGTDLILCCGQTIESAFKGDDWKEHFTRFRTAEELN